MPVCWTSMQIAFFVIITCDIEIKKGNIVLTQSLVAFTHDDPNCGEKHTTWSA